MIQIASNKEYNCSKHGYIAGYVLGIDSKVDATIKRKQFCIACIAELIEKHCGEVSEVDS